MKHFPMMKNYGTNNVTILIMASIIWFMLTMVANNNCQQQKTVEIIKKCLDKYIIYAII